MSAEIRGIRKEYYSLLHHAVAPARIRPPREEERDVVDSPASVVSAIASMVSDERAESVVDAELALVRYAPAAFVAGSWLRSSVQVRRTHTRLGEALLDSLYLILGEGDVARHQANQYRGVLATIGVSLSPLGSLSFVEDDRFGEADFEPGVVSLRAGRRPSYDLAEVLGVHAAMTLWGPPRAILDAAAEVGFGSFWDQAGRGSAGRERATGLLKRCLTEYAELGGADWQGVLAAARACLVARRSFVESLRPTRVKTPWQAMLDLVLGKSRHGFGFHGQVRLSGRSLDSFFDPSQPDLPGFLLALSKSPWIVPGRPEQSLLLSRTTQFGGTMFGIFDAKELETIAAWIAALPDSAQPDAMPQALASDHADSSAVVSGDVLADDEISGPRRAFDPPTLYHHFLRSADEQEWIAYSREYVRDRLSEVELAGDVATLTDQKLWPYNAAKLTAWVDAQLHQQVHGDPDVGAVGPQNAEMGIERLLGKQQVVWLLSQLAPAAIIDGAWLQGVSSPICSTSSSAGILLQIYRDELGSGLVNQHHGNIMRKVLEEQGIALPACDSLDFVRHSGFLKESFLTPVLWLAMSLHTQEFFPELLGLNLAIELAGVGRGYDRAIALLRKHGIDPYFFVLHNAIDNGASGHTAWSVRAINLYLDALSAVADTPVVGEALQRIFRGYATYGRSSAPLLRAIALRIGPSLSWRLLRQFVTGTTSAELH